MEWASLEALDPQQRIELLRELEYDTDGVHVLKDGQRVRDPYTEEEVLLERMAVLPGSVLVLDNNAYSLACYQDEHGD